MLVCTKFEPPENKAGSEAGRCWVFLHMCFFTRVTDISEKIATPQKQEFNIYANNFHMTKAYCKITIF